MLSLPDISVDAIFDPELVIPDQSSKENLEFWLRLERWTQDPRPRLATSTLENLFALISAPPVIPGLPTPEFWKIVQRLAARGYEGTGEVRTICDAHVREDYSPSFGMPNNVELLIRDMTSIGTDAGLVLATDAAGWAEARLSRDCEACARQRLYLTSQPNEDYAQAWRAEYILTQPTEPTSMSTLSTQLFPRLAFSSSAWSNINTLSGDPRDVTADLLKHLSVLNDHAISIWKESPNARDREQRLGSLGVLSSPESPQTHGSAKAMKAHTFMMGNSSVVCEWHTKLKRHTDRIYFSVQSDVVFIGAIIDHLKI